ncbi:MAG: TonB-dependent receptor [Sphingomonas sp.]
MMNYPASPLRPRTSFRAALFGASLIAIGATDVAAAQEAPSPAQADSAESGEITVTGSRIQRRDADAVGPVLTLTAEDIEKSGVPSVGELLQKLPSAGVSLNSNGTQGTSYGAAAVNLRYLGGAEGSGNRVLVLVNGRRWVDGVGQRGVRDFVDLNTMPMGMIESIEVLKDGASAIYGADAIAGVVNIKTIQPFDGIRISTRAGVTDDWDGAEYSGSLNFGKRFGRASIVLSGSFSKAEPIYTADRALTRQTMVPVTSVGNNPGGLYVLPGLAGNAYFATPSGFATTSRPITLNTYDTIFGRGALADNSFRVPSLPDDYYNLLAQGMYSVGPSERWGIYGRFGYELSDAVSFYFEGLYNKRTSDQELSPTNLDIGGTLGSDRGFYIPANHPYNPFGTANGVPAANALAFGSNQPWRLRKVLTEFGNRNNFQRVETRRLAAGLEGAFELLGNGWKWDAFASHAKNRINSGAAIVPNFDSLYLGLGDPAVCAATPGCVPINLFGQMTPEMIASIAHSPRETNYNAVWNASLNATGSLFTLPAGDVALAVGYEYRRNKADDRPDVLVNTPPTYLDSSLYAKTSSQTREVTTGSYDLHEIYGELSIPLLRDSPVGQALDLSLAARYSEYSTVGGKVTFKAGMGYRPVEAVLLRGTYAQGFRAPSILELYQGARKSSFQGTDPCNGGAAANPGLPGCAGVPAGYNQMDHNLNGMIPGTISGNSQLDPETSDSFSVGVALTPLRGLSLTVDYYDIEIKNAIASQSATQILQLCAQRGGVFCDLVRRDATTGAVINLLQGAQNLNSIGTDGVDVTVRYDFDTGIGRFGFVVDTSYLGSFTTTSPDPATGGEIVDERAGKGDRARSTYPHWKGQASIRWAGDAADAVLRARYIGSTTDVANTVKDDRTRAITYFDAEAGFDLENVGARLSIGINNLFDKAPPASYANAPVNYDIYTYDARGRFLYLRMSVTM